MVSRLAVNVLGGCLIASILGLVGIAYQVNTLTVKLDGLDKATLVAISHNKAILQSEMKAHFASDAAAFEKIERHIEMAEKLHRRLAAYLDRGAGG